jgi:hypothetical protein
MTSRTHAQRQHVAANELMSVAMAAALILLSGLLISVYSVMLRQAALRTGSQDCVRTAAMFVANDLRNLTVADPMFGQVGICDAEIGEGDARRHVTSFNRLYATLRLDDAMATQLQLPFISRMVAADFRQVKRDEDQLRIKLNVRGTELYKRAFKLASATNRANEKLISLNIKFGYLKSEEYGSGMPVIAQNGKYPCNVSVPIISGGNASFYQMAPETRFVDESRFAESKPGMIPSVVLLDAVFKLPPKNNSDPGLRLPRRAAVMLGGVSASAPHSVLLAGFPQGMPATFHSLRALTSASTEGTFAWQEAVDGNVPGDGHLVAAKYGFDGSPQMSPKDAIQAAFYHWLRSLGPQMNIGAVGQLINKSWASETPRQLEVSQQAALPGPNSALTKDTGARSRAFFFQSGPGAEGQSALRSAFEAQLNSQALPSSAIPLAIDASGACNVPGHTGFDRKLVADLLAAIYETNVVANESLGVAKSIVSRMERAEDQVQHSIEVTNEELGSITGNRARLESNGVHSTPELKRLQKSEADLTAAINIQRAKVTEYEQVKARANAVMSNAEAASQASFDLCSNMANYAADGIFRVENGKSFLLGSVYIFRPLQRSVTEDEIYKGNAPDLFWSKPFSVLEPAPEQIAIEGKLESTDSASSERNRALPRFVVFDSREILSAAPKLLVLDRSPFSDSGVPLGQLSYYGQNALFTGQNPLVGWSLLVRDVISGQSLGGQPLPSRYTKWCLGDDRAVSECPGLAVEIQVRSPVPIIPDLPVGSFLVSPANHERVSQIPPMPAKMF